MSQGGKLIPAATGGSYKRAALPLLRPGRAFSYSHFFRRKYQMVATVISTKMSQTKR